MKIKKVKNKKTLIAIVAVLLITVVGATFAYFQTTGTFRNVFQSGTFRLVTKEVFESPDNWKPGEEIPKTITIKNEGTIPAAVRMSYTEQWLDSEGQDITSSISAGSAIINFDNQEDWILKDGYYYYKYLLEANEETSSFIKSVTLNEELGAVTCTMQGNSEVCEASNPALGAKYFLTITKDAVQYDKYQEAWGTRIGITDKNENVMVLYGTKGNLQPGDVVGIGETEDFYVLSSDNSENGKTILFAKYALLIPEDNVEGPGVGLQSVDAGKYTSGGYPGTTKFSNTAYWMNGDEVLSKYDPNNSIYLDDSPGSYNNLQVEKWKFKYKNSNVQATPYVYDENSLVYQYISGEDGYINRLISMGAPSTITGRLISYEEVEEYSNLKSDGKSVIFNEQPYWLGSAYNHQSLFDASTTNNWSYTPNSMEHSHYDYKFETIRPIIEIPTSAIK